MIKWKIKPNNYNLFIALGCVIKGETYHFEVISDSVGKALLDIVNQNKNTLISNGIINAYNKSQAVKRSKSMRYGVYLSSDYRNRFAVDFGCGSTIKPLYGFKEYRARVSPRFRFNDKIAIQYVLSLRNRYNELGYIDDLVITNQQNTQAVFSLRNTFMITNVFSGNLIDSHNNACNFAKKTAMAEVTQPYDLVITSNSGYPLDQNLYQTVKGLSAASQIVKNKGLIFFLKIIDRYIRTGMI